MSILLLGCCPKNQVQSSPAKTTTGITAGKMLAFIVVGNVSATAADRVRNYIAAECHVQLRIKQPGKLMATPLEEQTKELAKLLAPGDLCLLVLAEEPIAVTSHGLVRNDAQVAIVNTTALRPGNSDSPEASEQYARRLEKEAMRAVGHLLGMESCPDPRCAMSTYANEEQLDAKGRNFCPPCQDKCRSMLESKGVVIIQTK